MKPYVLGRTRLTDTSSENSDIRFHAATLDFLRSFVNGLNAHEDAALRAFTDLGADFAYGHFMAEPALPVAQLGFGFAFRFGFHIASTCGHSTHRLGVDGLLGDEGWTSPLHRISQ